ncbi:MAG: T9SS type A sorting domain-containing protein [Reichenbachiella sp.]|uniref:T9SS type A sorting domain-containing protein n=1 Tax=Reichenbachiella sp. TaxID=2184521 RepID=UPI003267009B
MIKPIILFLALLKCSSLLLAQVQLEYVDPAVSIGDRTLSMPFAGGINSAQYQTMDMDGDLDLDLLIFDRSADQITCFENTGSEYLYRPDYNFKFPTGLQNWMVLADYDCDDKKDLFTYTGQGIRVFRNVSSDTDLSWELVADPLKTQGSSSLINLFFNPIDIPSISDLDDDGDLDILVFDFASSEQIEFHKNLSVENDGACGLTFARESRSYGEIRDCDCDDIAVGETCDESGRIQHAGGKAILSLDYNTDGKVDIIISQEACVNLNYSENSGNSTIASFLPFDNTFPVFDQPISFTSFPAAFYEDVTFDGKRDLLISSNERSNVDGMIDFTFSSFLYQNIGAGTSNNFTSSTVFLQGEMIDVGEYANPALVDIDGDGQDDLVLGNAGRMKDGNYTSSLSYFRSLATGLEWQTDDLFGLSSLGYTHIKPQLVDLNNDQITDLIFSGRDVLNASNIYYIINAGSNSELTFDLADIKEFNVDLTLLDDYYLDDVDRDGLLDLLIGLSSGQLDYYRNVGTFESPNFTVESQEYLGLTATSERSNLSITAGDVDGDGESDLITTDRTGELLIYSNYRAGNALAQASVLSLESNSSLVPTRLGRISKPAIGEFTGGTSVVVGSIQGGVYFFNVAGESSDNNLTLRAFPVPSSNDKIVNFLSNQSNTRLEIFSLTGKKIHELWLSAYSLSSVDLSSLVDGMYLAKATSNGLSCTLKIVLSSNN